MVQVKFNQVDEFIEELKAESKHGRVVNNLVRLTNLYTPSRLSPNIRHVELVATFLAGGQIVKLNRYCGDIWNINQDSDRKVMDKARDFALTIEKACQELGLETRTGVLTNEEE